MSWTKLSDDFGDECAAAGLSDSAFRTHVEGLLWAMRRENGGRITQRDLLRFAEAAAPELAVAELVAVDFWSAVSEGCWEIQHHMAHQPDPQVIAARRKRDSQRQTKRRRKLAGLTSDDDVSRRDSDRDSSRDTPSDNTRDPGRVGSGRDGKHITAKAAPTEAVPCEQCGRTSTSSLIQHRGALVCRSCRFAGAA